MNVNHADVVAAQKAQEPPGTFQSATGMLGFVLRVIARLPPAEQAGLVKAPSGGENVAFYAPAGTWVRINRVAYPDGTLAKILEASGPGEENRPSWDVDPNDIQPGLYVPVEADGNVEQPPKPVPVSDGKLEARVLALEQALSAQQRTNDEHVAAEKNLGDRVQKLENAPAPALVDLTAFRVHGNTGRIFGHAHTIDLRIERA